MAAKTYQALVAEALGSIREMFPWDLDELRQQNPQVLVVDLREADEVAEGMIPGSIHVPRGVLESACDWGYSDTVPELVQARQRPVVLACRSGNRSALAALTMQWMGYEDVYSLKTGVRGWNDYELPLVDAAGAVVDVDGAEQALSPPVRPEQMGG